jgi:glycogen operon protein
MPLQEFYSEDFLVEKKLVNYWGYNTIGFFAPESSYAAHASGGAQVKEFKILVAALHKAGIEVILDVVYNHSGEGWELGPTICFRGIDNLSYYPLHGGALEPKRFYVNHSGCGNCLDASHPAVVRLIVDSLRYWVDVMHVDGFRFDLATVLGRVDGQFNKNSPVFTAIIKDPVLKKVKLIAEPWDLKGSELGHFAREWSELNGRFRDTVRRFGKEQAGVLNDLKNCLVGSPDIFGSDQECAHKSINFVTNHDGFTLRDLVSYERKHNEANLENNRDGSEHNDSWNCGVEGATDDLGILNLRLKLAKNYMCVLLLSSGIPMILGGDEFLRTQQGNNNAYCQDDEISWFDWNLLEKNRPFFNFCQSVFGLMPTFKKTTFKEKFLYAAGEHCLSRFLHASKENSSFFIIFNAGHETQYMHLPKLAAPRRWRRKIDTSLSSKEDFAADGREIVLEPAGFYIANPCSSVVLIG